MVPDDIRDGQAMPRNAEPANVDLGAVFRSLPRFIRSEGRPAQHATQHIGDEAGSPIRQNASVFAGYVARHLSRTQDEHFVTTLCRPENGRLHAGRAVGEPLFHLRWEPGRPGGRRTCFELNIGGHDLAFIAAIEPGDRQDALSLKDRVMRKQSVLIDLAWENSLRFLPGADFKAWNRWKSPSGSAVRLGVRERPTPFAVFYEASPMDLSINTHRVAFHVADAVRRTSTVLRIL